MTNSNAKQPKKKRKNQIKPNALTLFNTKQQPATGYFNSI